MEMSIGKRLRSLILRGRFHAMFRLSSLVKGAKGGGARKDWCQRKGSCSAFLAQGSRRHKKGKSRREGDQEERIRERSSWRVLAFLRKIPRTALVTTGTPGFLSPLMERHRCSASRMTMAPWGVSVSMR